MATNEENNKRLKAVHNMGIVLIDRLIRTAEDPIFCIHLDYQYSLYLEWVISLPPIMRNYFNEVLDRKTTEAYIKYTESNILMCDGKTYSKEEINYYSMLN